MPSTTLLWLSQKNSKISTLQSPKTKAYVVTVVESKAIDIYRAKRRNPTGPLTEDMEGIPVDYHGNDGLARCMAKLPARHREFLLLKYAYGYENRELAQYFNLSMDAIYKLDQRGKEKLRLLCQEDKMI